MPTTLSEYLERIQCLYSEIQACQTAMGGVEMGVNTCGTGCTTVSTCAAGLFGHLEVHESVEDMLVSIYSGRYPSGCAGVTVPSGFSVHVNKIPMTANPVGAIEMLDCVGSVTKAGFGYMNNGKLTTGVYAGVADQTAGNGATFELLETDGTSKSGSRVSLAYNDGTNTWAGYFTGDVNITGELLKNGVPVGTGDIGDYDTSGNGIIDEAESVTGVTGAGINKYYGTNGAGTAGFFDLPVGGGGDVANPLEANLDLDGYFLTSGAAKILSGNSDGEVLFPGHSSETAFEYSATHDHAAVFFGADGLTKAVLALENTSGDEMNTGGTFEAKMDATTQSGAVVAQLIDAGGTLHPGSQAFLGYKIAAGATYAGYFLGNVYIDGNFNLTGTAVGTFPDYVFSSSYEWTKDKVDSFIQEKGHLPFFKPGTEQEDLDVRELLYGLIEAVECLYKFNQEVI